MTRRVVSVSLPNLAIERWERLCRQRGDPPPDERPGALATDGPHGRVVHAANRAARLAGIEPGARVVDMQALCPGLHVDYADLAGDRAALERLALWARRWCPWTARDGAAGLVLDTTGSDHLLGGEALMLARMETDLAGLGLSARLAVAPTRGAAWALARYGPVRAVSFEPLDLAPLPVAALRLDSETMRLLDRLGLKRVGDLMAMPRPALARRFVRAAPEANPLLRLDQATGRLDEPLDSAEPPPRFRAALRLAEPVLDPGPHLPGLAAALARHLERAEAGARRLVLSVFRTDGELRRIDVATARAVRDPDHVARLFAGRVGELDPGFGFDALALEATHTDPLPARQAGLDGAADHAGDLARLIDRLSTRFGARRIFQSATRESHVPERARIRVAPLAAPPAPDPAALATPPARPPRLLDPPEEVRVLYAVPEGPPVRFVWRGRTISVARYAGPERIAPEWWHDRPGTRLRDYFRIEEAGGRRLWLYREGLAGDGRGGAPRWFLHGLFA